MKEMENLKKEGTRYSIAKMDKVRVVQKLSQGKLSSICSTGNI